MNTKDSSRYEELTKKHETDKQVGFILVVVLLTSFIVGIVSYNTGHKTGYLEGINFNLQSQQLQSFNNG